MTAMSKGDQTSLISRQYDATSRELMKLYISINRRTPPFSLLLRIKALHMSQRPSVFMVTPRGRKQIGRLDLHAAAQNRQQSMAENSPKDGRRTVV
jgi:hypothetical protein